MFALHKQWEVSVADDSFGESIMEVEFERSDSKLEELLRYRVPFMKDRSRPSSLMRTHPDWVRFVSYRGVCNKGKHERNATSQDMPFLAYPGH